MGEIHKVKTFLTRKMPLIMLGVFLCLVLVEIGLRLGGVVWLSHQDRGNMLSLKRKGAYRIMCIGESTTALGGEYAYPSLLEQILNQRDSGIKFSVINKGVAGIETSMIISQLEHNVGKYKPDMVIVMMGINDFDARLAGFSTPGRGFLSNTSRLYKLAGLLWSRVMEKTKGMDSPKMKENKNEIGPPLLSYQFNEEKYGKAEGELRKAVEMNPSDDSAYVNLGAFYAHWGEYIQAESVFKKAVEMNPKNDNAYLELGWCYRNQGKYYQAIEPLKKSVELNSENAGAYTRLGWCYNMAGEYAYAAEALLKAIEIEPQNYRAYFELGWCYKNQGEFAKAGEAFKKSILLKPKNDRAYRALAGLYQESGEIAYANECYKRATEIQGFYYNAVTYHNYLKLKEILNLRGVKLVCAQYPMLSVESLKKMFPDREGVIFVDNEKIFKDALKNAEPEEYFIDMFAGVFGHCTQKGNRLLAKNIADTILKEYFKIETY